MGEASWHQRWQKKEREEPCFLLLFSAPVKMVCLGSFFSCFCCFICCYCTHQPASFVTPQRPLVELRSVAMCLKVCACVCLCGPGQIPPSPKLIFSVSFIFALSLTHTHTQALSFSCGQLFFFFFSLFFEPWDKMQNCLLPASTHAHTHTSNSGPFLHLQARFSLLTL